MEIEASERATLLSTLATRPINTKRKYDGYQKGFIEWCSSKRFCDGGTITKGKLHLFLSEEAVGRESKKKKGKVVGGSTVCRYVNAVVDLYNQQVAPPTNIHARLKSSSSLRIVKQSPPNQKTELSSPRDQLSTGRFSIGAPI